MKTHRNNRCRILQGGCQYSYHLGLPLQAVKNGTIHYTTVPAPGALFPHTAETAVLGVSAGGGHHLPQCGFGPGVLPQVFLLAALHKVQSAGI